MKVSMSVLFFLIYSVIFYTGGNTESKNCYLFLQLKFKKRKYVKNMYNCLKICTNFKILFVRKRWQHGEK